jgi:putative inorganic carbon (HCO3(-)) transporter
MGRYILLYYLVINHLHTLEQVKKLLWVSLASSVVVAVYGYYQYFSGIMPHGVDWVDASQFPDLKFRMYSTLKNPNLLAGYLVSMIAIGAGLGFKEQTGKIKAVLAALVVLLGGCLLLTYSRGAWISLLAVVCGYGMLCNRKIFWIFLLLPILMLLFGHDIFIERFASVFDPTDTSATMRLAMWQSTLSMIADKPFLGIGWGAYWMVYPHYDFFIHNPNIKILHAHNMYLNIAAEIGIPGFLAFMAVLCGHIRLALSVQVKNSKGWVCGMALGLLSAMWGIIINGFTDYVLFNIQLSMMFWMMNALIVVIWEQTNRQQTAHTYFRHAINYYH